MSQDTFRPFSDYLEKEQALSVLQQAVAGADDGEIFLERRRSEGLVLDDGRIKNASYNASEGFGLRAIHGDVTGYSHSTEISQAALMRAADTARLAVRAGGGQLSEGPKATNRHLYNDQNPMEDAPFAVKIETLKAIDAFCRDLDPRVVQASATISASLQEIEILRPDGQIFSYRLLSR